MKAELVAVVVVTLLSTAAALTCDGGFTLVGSACYLIPDEELAWQEAMDYCKGLTLPNGKMAALARVDSCPQLREVWDFINYGGYPIVDYWLGARNTMDPAGEFRWDSTGERVPAGVPFWFPGQPDFPFQEASLSLDKNGYFADEKNTIKQRFICQLL